MEQECHEYDMTLENKAIEMENEHRK